MGDSPSRDEPSAPDRADRSGPDVSDPDLSAPPSTRDSLEALLGPGDHVGHATMLAPGDELAGRFRIERLIGAGGMGVVYLATDRRLERQVAIKLHHAGAGTARLRREAVAMARLAHPNVIAVFEVGSVDNHPFVAMEYIAGQTLRSWLAAHPRSRRERLAKLLGAGAGLAAAHDAGLIHRDFKPENVLVGSDGRVRVGDFGLARGSGGSSEDLEKLGDAATVDVSDAALAVTVPAPGSAHPTPATTPSPPAPRTPTGPLAVRADSREFGPLATPLTRTGALLGTPAYMAPEQLAGRGVDARADQFAFCVVAWELLFGERPFTGATSGELHGSITRGARKARGHTRVPAAIRRVLERGLSRAPMNRFADMHDLLAALTRAARRRVVLAGAAIAIVAAATAAFAFAMTRTPGPSCDGADADIARLPRTLPAQLLAAGGPLAPDGAARVSTQLDRFSARYRALSRRACELGTVDRTWSPDLYARGRGCLALRLRAAVATVTVGTIARADVPDVVEEALGMPDLTSCLDPAILAALPPLPTDRVRLEQVVDARAQLDAASADLGIDRFARARERLQRAQASPAADDPSVAARIAFVRGGVLREDDKLDAAEQAFRDAYFEARTIDDVDVELVAITSLIHLTGYVREHWAIADDWIRNGLADAERARARTGRLAAGVYAVAAAVAVEHDHPDDANKWATTARTLLGEEPTPELVGLLQLQATMACAADRTADCQALDRRAVDMTRQLFGTDHPHVARVLANAAMDVALLAPNDAADLIQDARRILDANRELSSLAYANTLDLLAAAMVDANVPTAPTEGKLMLEEARARFLAILGPDSPEIALVDANLALLLSDAGDLAGARTHLEHALAVDEQVFGVSSGRVAAVLYNLAVIGRDQRDYAAAAIAAERSAAIRTTLEPGTTSQAQALLLAAEIANLDHRSAHALALAETARALPVLQTPGQEQAWALTEIAHALIDLHRDLPRARTLLSEARATFVNLHLHARVDEDDELAGKLPQ